MIVGREQKKIKEINISIDRVQIERVHPFNFFGILLDESLTWTDHTNMVANKISKVTGVLYRLKSVFPIEILTTLYNTCIGSYINYGSLVWKVKSNRIEVPQKKAIRLGQLKVYDIFKLKLLNSSINYRVIYCPHISIVIMMLLIKYLLVYCVSILFINL